MPVTQIKKSQAVREQVSKEEWETRVNLAACYRLMHVFGMTEMIANHISARVPGTEDHFLINPYGMLYEEITASCLIKIDLDGNILFNRDRLRHQPGGLRDPQRGARGAARRRLRDPHAHARRHGGVGDEVRAAAARADRDALRRHRLSRLRRPGAQPRRAEAPGRATSATRGDDPAQPRPADRSAPSIPEAFNNIFRLERACQLQVDDALVQHRARLPPDEVVQYDNLPDASPACAAAAACSSGRRCCGSSTKSILPIATDISGSALNQRAP